MLLMAALVWGISFISQSKGVESMSPAYFNGVRSILGGLVLLPVIGVLDFKKSKEADERCAWSKTLWIGGLVCGLFLCGATTIQSAGMVYTSPGKAGFLTAMYMVIIPVVQIIMGKKIRPVTILSVIIAVAGLYLMCVESGFSINKGDVLIMICSFIFAGHIIAIAWFSPRVDGVKLSCLQFFVCGIINIIMVFVFEEPKGGLIFENWGAIAYSGIMSCGVAYTLQIVGQKYTEPTTASILMSLESVFATLATVILVACGWDLTGGALSIREIMGCVLMFGAIMLVQLPEKEYLIDNLH